MTLRYFGLTDIGLNRLSNQDVWAALPEIGFFALADGMGGRNGGEIAAQEAVQSISKSIRRLAKHSDSFKKEMDWNQELNKAIEDANRTIYRMGCETKILSGMGTTLCCLLWIGKTVCYGHVGDSRIYRLRAKKLKLLTQDHSLFEKWLAQKNPKIQAPPKHILTRALGTSPNIQPEVCTCTAEPDDLFLLCSDGLSNALAMEELQDILTQSPSLNGAAKKMIFKAKNKGSSDNITVLIIQPADKSTFYYGENLPR